MSPWPRAPRSCDRALVNTSLSDSRRVRQNHDVNGYAFAKLTPGKKKCIRILLHNTNGIGFVSAARSRQTLKLEKLKNLVLTHSFDFIGLSEVNKDWRRIPSTQSIHGTMSSWTEHCRVKLAYNTHGPADRDYLVGGTASIALGEAVFRVSGQHSDDRRLGRWSWFVLTGKNQLKTAIITCYCPVISHSPGSAYSQQLAYMASYPELIPPDYVCPRQLYGYDLRQLVLSLQDSDHQVILGGDFNSEYSDLKQWMLDLGMVNCFEARYGSCGPRTCLRSKDSPIDCIFVSPQLTIAKGGFLSYGRLDSDHRGVWIDIPEFLLFGFNPPDLVNPNARRLKLKDPRVVSKYVAFLQEKMRAKDLFQRMDSLHRRTVYPLPQPLVAEYESVDKEVCALMDAAEKQCRRINAGALPWSPSFARARKMLEYWRGRLRHKQGKHRDVRHLLTLQKQLEIQYDPTLTQEDIVQKIQEAFLHRKQCYLQADNLRLDYCARLAKAKEDAGQGPQAAILRNMHRLESQRKMFRRIRYIEQKLKGGSTTQVVVTEGNSVVEYTSQDDVERAIIQENEKKYHQIEDGGCQFLSDDFVAIFGKYGEGPATEETLRGTLVPPASANQDTTDFLRACQYVDGANDLSSSPDIVTRYRNMVRSFRLRKETTTTYHHHLGHFKAVMSNDYLSWFFFQRAEIPIISGYSPSRHRRCVDLMILKRAMNFNLSKQRTLGILDTEFNHANKCIGYTTTSNAIKLNSFATEQFSRPGRSAIDQCISKRCAIDHHQSTRQCFALTSCDLAGCYDRIVHTAAALALLRIGLSKPRIFSMFETIQRMTHKIRTAFGDSEGSYGGDNIGDWSNAPQGVLQGNASGPAVWTAVSSVIFDVLHQRGFSVHFCFALSKEVFKIVGYSYVDDCDLFQSGENPRLVLDSMQRLIHSWGSLAEVTGGALAPSKSWWYLVDYVWHRGKWVASDAGDESFDLSARTPTGESVSLRRLHARDSTEMLGVWMSPSGDKTKIVEVLKTHAVEWAGKIRMARMSQEEAWTALTMNISAKIRYPLPCCTLSHDDCRSIMFPAIRTALRKSKVASNLPVGIRHGPMEDGGMGVLSLYHYQGTSRIAALVDHCMRQTPTGKQIQICIEDLLLEIGMYGSLWTMPFLHWSKWTSHHSWIFAICQYNHEHSVRLATSHFEFTPRRQNDRSLMDLARTITTLGSSLKAFNRVRISHRVVHLSDVTTADGRCLDQQFLRSTPFSGCRNDFTWPVKHCVKTGDYTEWRRVLRRIFCGPGLTLPMSLGAWSPVSQPDHWTDTWDWFISHDGAFLFHRYSADLWHRHLRVPRNRHNYFSQFLGLLEPPTVPLYRCSVKHSRNRLVVLSSSPPTDGDLVEDDVWLDLNGLQIRSSKVPWTVQHISSSPSTARLRLHLLAGTAIAVSDGSFFPDSQTGACGWIIATPDNADEWVQGGGLIPGDPEIQSAYRSELGGQLGISAFVESLLLDLPVGTKLPLRSACDGISALRQTGMAQERLRSSHRHIDLLSLSSCLWEASFFCIQRQHVRGHQDDTGRTLTLLESLNCQMDALAKTLATSAPIRRSFHTSLGIGSISCHGSPISSCVQQSLYQIIVRQHYIQTLCHRLDLAPQFMRSRVHWWSFRRARRISPISQRIFVTKWLSGDVATGAVMFQRRQRVSAQCPSCPFASEDLVHVLTCPSMAAASLRTTLLLELDLWLASQNTDPHIRSFLVSHLQSWFCSPRHDAYDLPPAPDPLLLSAFADQLEIGWHGFLCGILSLDLVHAQQRHYDDIQSRRKGRTWAARVIPKLWHMLHSLWIHRNSCLHDTDAINSVHGLGHLRTAVTSELSLGLGLLPRLYRSYFTTYTSTLLLSKPVYFLKRWLLVIRTARERFQPDAPQDSFSHDARLRRWIGLLGPSDAPT